jgi:hypothetical protein
MLVEAFLLSASAVITSLVGVPLAVKLARAELPSFGATAPATERKWREVGVTAGFEPLDLGPDLVQWPSAKPWPTSRIAAAEWPSKSWNDEHFGRHWRDGTSAETVDQGFHAMKARSTDAASAPAPAPKATRSTRATRPKGPPPPQRRAQTGAEPAKSAEESFFASAAGTAAAAASGWAPDPDKAAQLRAQQEAARREAAAKQQEAIRQQAARQAQLARQQQAQQQRRATPKAPPTRPARPQPTGGGGPPTRAELEAMVASEGLAGTVQHIMRRTGWDFRKAAQYLARTRAGN